jgi:hypothetical protein
VSISSSVMANPCAWLHRPQVVDDSRRESAVFPELLG